MIALDGSASCDQTIDVVSRRVVHLGHVSEIELKWNVLVFERMSAGALEALQIAGLQLSCKDHSISSQPMPDGDPGHA